MSIIDNAGSQARKNVPLFSGLMAYFPDALCEVAALSKYGNDKHNPGEPLHWSENKSSDHDDCVARHLLDAGKRCPESGHRHRTMVAWRALAALQTEIKREREAAAAIAEDEHNEAVVQEYVSAGMGDADRRVGPKDRRVVDFDVRRKDQDMPFPWEVRGDGMARAGCTMVNGVRRYGRRAIDPKVT